jgi:hypothetical protein
VSILPYPGINLGSSDDELPVIDGDLTALAAPAAIVGLFFDRREVDARLSGPDQWQQGHFPR